MDLRELNKLVTEGYIRKVSKESLMLFNYTDKTTYDRNWNELTRVSRGIIFDMDGNLIAKPFPKFFNLGEMEETRLTALPDEPYEVYEKVDGSLGIIYHHDNEWRVATRGSFNSEQAVKASEMLKNYKTECLSPGTTYLVEIVYPENKIVVSYSWEELVLLGAYKGLEELPYDELYAVSAYTGFKLVTKYYHTIEEMIELQKTIPKDQEGFVVRFASGLRVKIKGAEYMRIHKMISNMSPLSFWESMVNGTVNKDCLIQLPEEFKGDFEPIVAHLEEQYRTVFEDIVHDVNRLPTGDFKTKEGLKAVGLFVQGESHGLKHPGAVFSYILDKKDALNKYIMKHIRPDSNNLKVIG